MRFRCERDVLFEALSVVGRAVSTRAGALQVLSGVRLELAGDELRLLGTDNELGISMEVTVGGAADGVAVVPSRLFAEIVRSLEPGAVTVEIDGETAQVSAGRSQFAVRVIPPDEFPRPSVAVGDPIEIDAQVLDAALRQVVPAASTDDSRPILTGVLFTAEEGDLRLVATDSYRLARRDVRGQTVLADGQSVLLPSRALNELRRLLGSASTVTMQLGQNEASFGVGRSRLVTRLIPGDFPNYRGLIPQSHPNKLVVNREALLDAVRRVRLMAREATPIRLLQSAQGLDLLAITQDVGQAHETVDARYDGEELTIAFNPEYLVDGLEVLGDEDVVLDTLDARNPAVLRGTESADFLYLLMPVRVS